MPLIESLLQRAQAADEGVYSHRPWDSLAKSDRPYLEKCWFAWVRAETACRDDELGPASNWLTVADQLLAERPDLLCSAEVESTWAYLLEAAGEYRDAMGHAYAGWELWYGLSTNANDWEVESVRSLVRALVGPEEDLQLDDQRLRLEWMADRLSPRLLESSKAVIRLCAPMGDSGPAETVFEKMKSWLEQNLRPDGPMGLFAPVSHADFLGDMANLHDQLGQGQRSLDMFLAALDMLAGVPDHPQVVEMRSRYQFNAANQMAKTGRHEEALAEFTRLAEVFQQAGHSEAAIRARHAAVVSRWKMGDTGQAKAQLEAILLDYENRHEQSRDRRERGAIEQNLSRAYSLWLSIAAAENEDSDLAKRRILGQLVAMRENSWKFNRMWSLVFDGSRPKKMFSDVEMLDARLARRADSVLLILEQGVDELVLVAMSSGTAPLAERVRVAAGSPEFSAALVGLLNAYHQVTNQLIDRSIGVTSGSSGRFEESCKTAWSHLPETIKEALAGARTLFYSPSNAGAVDEIPIELLHDGSDYLSLSKPLVRVTSIGQLLETLSPNRVNRAPSGRGLIVRAGEIAALGPLPGSDAELGSTRQAFAGLGKEPRILEAPSARELMEALGSDIDVLHFIGHGFADEAGEALLLAEDERLRATDLGRPGLPPAPISVLSSCMLGQTRQLSTGEQRGVANTFLRQGAPAVIAATSPLPDHVGSQFAAAFYFHARRAPVGEAVRRARRSLAAIQVHPAAWASFVALGEPEATLAPSVAAALPAPGWPGLLIRFLATRSPDYLAAARDGIEKDDALTAEQRTHIEQALSALAEDQQSFFTEERLEREVHFDVALAEQDLTHQLTLLVGALRRGDEAAPSEQQKMRYLGNCLAVQGLMKDSYLLALLAVLFGDQVLAAITSEQGRSLLRRGMAAAQWLSADAEGLSDLNQKLDRWRSQLERSVAISVQEMAGVDQATFEAADAGDRQAQKQMLRNLAVRQASASVLASDLPWTHWMLRMIGCASEQATKDLFGVIERDRKSGALSDERAAVLDNLVRQYLGPDEVGAEAEQAVLAGFPEGDPDRRVIDLFLVHDKLATGAREVPLDEVQAAIGTSQELEAPGAETYFAGVWSERVAGMGMLDEAARAAKETLGTLEKLVEQDPEYGRRVVMMATVLLQLAQHTGDAATAARLEQRYGDQIRSLIAEQSAP